MKAAGSCARGFTILEILVACAVLSMLLVLILEVTSQTSRTLRQVTGQVDAYQGARMAFDDINRTLAQATLNTYWDYERDSNGKLTGYTRKADLDFLVNPPGSADAGIYFVAPLAYTGNATDEMPGLLNAVGYWVEYGDDASFKPGTIGTGTSRFRLMQAVQPTEDLAVMTTSGSGWISALQSLRRPLADNVIALIALPKWSTSEDPSGTVLSPSYAYDARSGTSDQIAQLPPMVQITMIAIDEKDASRLGSALESTINSALAGRFSQASAFDDDLSAVRSALAARNISNQVFNTAIPLRESKWSKTR